MKSDTSRSSFDARKHFRGVLDQQGRVALDSSWNEQQDIVDHLRTATTADLVGPSGGPVAGAGFALTATGTELRVSAGHYYVDGLLVECDEEASVWAQPDVPDGSAIVRLEDGTDVAGPKPPAGRYLVYLDVWDLHRTALEDESIREVALGGPDTTTRVKTVWQVKLLRLGAPGAGVDCTANPPAWQAIVAGPTGLLEARAEPAEADSGPCVVPAGAGYRGLENQHYRVEVHRGGTPGTATFTWARDNASVVASWVSGPDAEGAITVASPGRDSVSGFAPGMWVELVDDTRELLGRPGTLVQLADVRGNRLTLSPAAGIDIADYPVRPRVRRWDSAGALTVERPAAGDGWLPLEQGVQVRFAKGTTYPTGAYWLIPARTNVADVVWPRADDGVTPLAVPPKGIYHHYAKLGLATFDGTAWQKLHDCRSLFPHLTDLVALHAVSGDGQTATPAGAGPIPLAQPLVVGVSNGGLPVAGAKVRFAVATGTGTVAGGATATVATGADGQAQVAWQLDPATPVQQVRVTRLDDAGNPTGLPVGFTASLLTAGRTAYTPGCDDLAGVTTVQEAIDKLCDRPSGGAKKEPGFRVQKVALAANGDALENDAQVSAAALSRGIIVVCDAELDRETVNRATCFVTLELPYPLNDADRSLWDVSEVLGYETLVLAAELEAEGKRFRWRPTKPTIDWLRRLPEALKRRQTEATLLCRLVVKGNHVTSGKGELYLDGDAYAEPGATRRIRLPSGDDRFGGTFETWFWLAEGEG